MENLAKFSDRFFEFEYENRLFEKKIDDIYFWNLIRDRIHNNILISCGDMGKTSYTVPKDMSGKIKTFVLYCIHAFANVFTGYKQADTLIVNHPRKVKVDDKYQDIYSQWLVERLKSKGENYLVLDYPKGWSEHYIEKDANTRNLENFSIIKKVYYKFFAKNTLMNNPDLINISNGLKKEFGSDGDLFNVCFAQMNIFKADYAYYTKILKKIKPKKIYYVVINSLKGLIAAAHDLDIPIEEIQHGLMSRYHLGYSFPYNDKIPYFPDRMCLFGEYWKDITPLPLKGDSFDYYKNSIRKYEPLPVKEIKNNKTVFISQPNIGQHMLKFLKGLLQCKESEDLDIIVKLHPTEYDVWRNIYPELIKMSEYSNVTVIDNFDMSLYEILRSSDTVIGVASTALFEALYFGCDVFLMDVPGAEWVKPLINEKLARTVNRPESFLQQIKTPYKREIDIDYIFHK